MAISRNRKEELVAQYVELLGKSDAIFVAEYAGLDVKKLEALRTEVRKVDGNLFVTKNTLLRKALEQAGRPIPDTALSGQIAAGFALGEAPALAKTFKEFAKKEDRLVIRGGVLGNEIISDKQVIALAEMPSLDELRGQLLGIISAPARNVAMVVASGVRQVVNVLDAYVKKDESEGTAEVAA